MLSASIQATRYACNTELQRFTYRPSSQCCCYQCTRRITHTYISTRQLYAVAEVINIIPAGSSGQLALVLFILAVTLGVLSNYVLCVVIHEISYAVSAHAPCQSFGTGAGTHMRGVYSICQGIADATERR